MSRNATKITKPNRSNKKQSVKVSPPPVSTNEDFMHPDMPAWAKPLQDQLIACNQRIEELSAKHAQAIAELELTLQQLVATQTQLADAEARIAALSFNPNTTALPSNEIYTHDEEVQTATTPPEQDVIVDPSVFSSSTSTKPTASYAAKLKAPRSNKPTARELARIARTFAPPSNDQGFQYIYVSTNKRYPIKIMRTRLARLGLERRRVIDVHYPDQNVVATLVHNDYAAEALQYLTNARVSTIQFDLLHPLVLRNPKHQHLDEASRKIKLIEIQHQRHLKTISFLQYPIKIAVARDFVKREWITAAEMQKLIANEEQNPQKAHKNQDDDNMEEIASSFQAP
jgi:hypothetical protein